MIDFYAQWRVWNVEDTSTFNGAYVTTGANEAIGANVANVANVANGVISLLTPLWPLKPLSPLALLSTLPPMAPTARIPNPNDTFTQILVSGKKFDILFVSS